MIETATAYFVAGEIYPAVFWFSIAIIFASGIGLLTVVVG